MEENKNKNKEEKKNRKKWLLLLLLILIIFLLLFGIIRSGGLILGRDTGLDDFLNNIWSRLQREDVDVEKTKDVEVTEECETVEEETVTEETVDVQETVDTETRVVEDEFDFEEEEEMESENYNVVNIKFGGTAIVQDDEIEGTALEISSVDTEILPASNPELVNVLVTWKTNKISIAELSYARKSGEGGATIRESRYGTDHGIFIENLLPNTDYVFKIEVKDRRGREASTDFYDLYTKDPREDNNGFIDGVVNMVEGWFN